MMKRIVRQQKGFSLIEVLIALVIFAVGILGFAGLEIVAIKNTAFSKDLAKANAHAQQLVEQFKVKAFKDVALGSETSSLESGKFTRSVTVTENTAKDVKYLTISVRWTDPSYGPKTVTVSTEFYENPSI